MEIKDDKTYDPATLMKAIELADRAVKLEKEKLLLMEELRRTVARKAMSLGLLPRHVKRGEPCPICTKPRTLNMLFSEECTSCKHNFGHGKVLP